MGFQLTINDLSDDIFGQINNVLISNLFDGKLDMTPSIVHLQKSAGVLKVRSF